jgi:hypothetical protein
MLFFISILSRIVNYIIVVLLMKQMSLFDTPNIKGAAGSKKAIRTDKNI